MTCNRETETSTMYRFDEVWGQPYLYVYPGFGIIQYQYNYPQLQGSCCYLQLKQPIRLDV